MREGLLSCEIASCKSNEKLVLRLPIKKPALRKSEERERERERKKETAGFSHGCGKNIYMLVDKMLHFSVFQFPLQRRSSIKSWGSSRL